ncbi:MAG: peptide ABC transporter ATP-binding protein, partial [Lachnospiraceae bacterium]|nr:peptide ABC transporter ATP-binding protein [Lachnospiraceae bacterium]
HPYTRALLSAIPKPDPRSERKRQRILYDPKTAHDYSTGDTPSLKEITPGHFVYCNNAEFEKYKSELK